MGQDRDAEEAALRAQATMAFEVLMGIRKVVRGANTRRVETYAQYVAEDALEAYRRARDELEAFLKIRRDNDASRRQT